MNNRLKIKAFLKDKTWIYKLVDSKTGEELLVGSYKEVSEMKKLLQEGM